MKEKTLIQSPEPKVISLYNISRRNALKVRVIKNGEPHEAVDIVPGDSIKLGDNVDEVWVAV